MFNFIKNIGKKIAGVAARQNMKDIAFISVSYWILDKTTGMIARLCKPVIQKATKAFFELKDEIKEQIKEDKKVIEFKQKDK